MILNTPISFCKIFLIATLRHLVCHFQATNYIIKITNFKLIINKKCTFRNILFDNIEECTMYVYIWL